MWFSEIFPFHDSFLVMCQKFLCLILNHSPSGKYSYEIAEMSEVRGALLMQSCCGSIRSSSAEQNASVIASSVQSLLARTWTHCKCQNKLFSLCLVSHTQTAKDTRSVCGRKYFQQTKPRDCQHLSCTTISRRCTS